MKTRTLTIFDHAARQHTRENPRQVRGLAGIYDVRMAQFVLKIEKLSHVMGTRGSRLWLLNLPINRERGLNGNISNLLLTLASVKKWDTAHILISDYLSWTFE